MLRVKVNEAKQIPPLKNDQIQENSHTCIWKLGLNAFCVRDPEVLSNFKFRLNQLCYSESCSPLKKNLNKNSCSPWVTVRHDTFNIKVIKNPTVPYK